jgi:hypothetical protein
VLRARHSQNPCESISQPVAERFRKSGKALTAQGIETYARERGGKPLRKVVPGDVERPDVWVCAEIGNKDRREIIAKLIVRNAEIGDAGGCCSRCRDREGFGCL